MDSDDLDLFADCDPVGHCDKCGRPLRARRSATLGMGPHCREGEPYRCPYAIVIDTREQDPFDFDGLRMPKSRGGGLVEASLEIVGLKSGDYSVVGFESRVAIERKSRDDLYGTLGKGRSRFVAELERLSALDFAAVVVEADWVTLLHNPPGRSRVPPQSIQGSVLALQMDFPRVQWQLAIDRRHAEWITFSFLDRFWWKANQ